MFAGSTDFGNVSYRLGTPATLAQTRAAVAEIPAALGVVESMANHLSTHGADLAQPAITLGPWLEVDAALSDVTAVSGADAPRLADARYLLKGVMRPPYILAEQSAGSGLSA